MGSGEGVTTTRLTKGAKVWAKLFTSGDKTSKGLILSRESVEKLAEFFEDSVLFEEEGGRVSLLGLVEVGKVQHPGHLLVRSSTPVGEGGSFMLGTGTSGPITCEWCGTEWNEDADPEDGGGEDLGFADFNGVQVVRECCGKLFDILYDDLGEVFFETFLRELVDGVPPIPRGQSHLIQTVIEATMKLRAASENLKLKCDDALGPL